MKKDASISGCGTYRYWLSRSWGGNEYHNHYMIFVMLNPSTADAKEDDPTIRRCVSFAKREGYDGLIVINLFAYRATDPKELKNKWPFDTVGIHNPLQYYVWPYAYGHVLPIVCAWGTKGNYLNQDKKFIEMCHKHDVKMFCLGTTKAGHPKHPLYLKSDTPLVEFQNKDVLLDVQGSEENDSK